MRSRGMFRGRHGECGGGFGFKRGMRGERGGFGRGWGGPEGRGRHGRGGRLFDHGTLRWLLLSLIAEKPSHGYELIKAIEARLGGAYSPSPGVIYPSLTLLEEMGALTSATEGGKKLYSITDEGRALLAENADALAGVRAILEKFAARAMRPPAIADAVGRLRAAIHGRLAGEPALTEAQVQAVADILNAAADKVEQA